jgi:catechol 2,3-dioxygenase-like lactoylglutathione lyase family enzyme
MAERPPNDAIELDEVSEDGAAPGPPDPRPLMPEPLPVRLVAVADVRLAAPAGVERALDAFYVDLLGCVRHGAPPKPRRLIEPLLGVRTEAPVTAPPLALGLRNREDEPAPRPADLPATVPPGNAPAVAEVRTRSGRPALSGPIYLADNFAIRFDILEAPVERDTFRPLTVEVPSLAEAEAKLIEAEMEYTRQRGLNLGEESLVLLDPAGNWVEIVEMRVVP